MALTVPLPVPNSGDVLEISGDLSGVADALVLEWRPFRNVASLSLVEYKIMAVEWPCEERPADGTLSGRLRRAADMATQVGRRATRTIGYVRRNCATSAALRVQTDRLEWRTEGLRPGMYYRFYVCARYAGLPTGALARPSGLPTDMMDDLRLATWPDEQCERFRDDGALWETSLSGFGLWSSVVNTLHLQPYMVRGATDSSAPLVHSATNAASPRPEPLSPVCPSVSGYSVGSAAAACREDARGLALASVKSSPSFAVASPVAYEESWLRR